MSHAALVRLVDAGAALTAALDEGGAPAIDAANHRLAQAVGDVAAAGAWRASPDLRDALLHARALLDAARARVNFLADQTARRLDRLAALTGGQGTPAYGRHGRRR